tara:strand:+ start:933 stop:2549 length:1617 start_codon:yes stop_codon:yes gene_type:complete
MQTTSTNAAQLIERKDPSLNPMTRIMRTDSAVDAQGFAQILQAFDTGTESKQPEAAKETEPREQAPATDTDEQGEVTDDTGEIEEQAAKDNASSEQPSSDTDDQSRPDGQATSDETSVAAGETNPSDTDGSSATNQPDASEQPKTQGQDAQADLGPISQSPVAGEGTPAADQPTLNQETTMRLLDQQSEQAKLTIKGVARTLTHAADVSVSSQAVDTRLGQDQSGAPIAKEHAPSQSAPSPATQPQSPQQGPPQGPVSDQGSTPPDPARTTSMPNGPTHLHTPDPLAKPVDAQVDQSNTNAQQARSQRAESAIGIAQSNTKPNTVAQAPTAATLRAVGLGKQNSAQTVRAVSSVDAGLIGNDQRNAQPGSLVEKMKGASLPNQANRASVLAQVQRGLASMLRSGNNEMTLKLTPGHLGSLKIQLKSEGSKLHVRFETSSTQASEHLSESVKELGAHLRTKGISFDKIEIHQQPSQGTETNTAGEQNQSDSSSHQGTDQRHASDQRPQQSPQEQALSDGASISDEPESIWTELGLDATA